MNRNLKYNAFIENICIYIKNAEHVISKYIKFLFVKPLFLSFK